MKKRLRPGTHLIFQLAITAWTAFLVTGGERELMTWLIGTGWIVPFGLSPQAPDKGDGKMKNDPDEGVEGRVHRAGPLGRVTAGAEAPVKASVPVLCQNSRPATPYERI
jgi:hypothetical protein